MNLKVKYENIIDVSLIISKYYRFDYTDNKIESIFKTIQYFVDALDKAKRTIIKLQKERIKKQEKKKREMERNRKKNKKSSKKMTVQERIESKKKKLQENEEKGNLLFHDIKIAASKFRSKQKKMAKRLSINFQEKIMMSKGKMADSVKNDKIKKRLSSRMQIDMNQVLKGMNNDTNNNGLPSINTDLSVKKTRKRNKNNIKTPNTLTIPQASMM